MRLSLRAHRHLLLLAFAGLTPLAWVAAQTAADRHDWNPGWGRGWWNRVPPKFPDPDRSPDGHFSFCRVLYDSVRDEPLGHGWNTDYPNSDINFMIRMSEITKTPISWDEEGQPNHVVVRLTDEALYDYPFIFMSDVGTAGFNPDEVTALRSYLLKGGFLHVDDFWGEAAWDHWAREIGKVLPPNEYPIVDVPLDHEIFGVLYQVTELPQIPSIQFWRRSGGTSTSERGWESEEVHYRGIFDQDGRLMVVMTHNTDIADGWEREGENREFFFRFSVKAYPVGINTVLYALTH